MLGLSCSAARETLVPQPGVEPGSPALKGSCFTAGPPGKSPATPAFQLEPLTGSSQWDVSRGALATGGSSMPVPFSPAS